MIFVYLFVSVLFMALAEYSIHRWWQHEHSYDHYHRHHYMNDNENKLVDLPPWISLPVASPILLPLFLFAPEAFYCFGGVVLWHSVAWTTLHRSFHGVEIVGIEAFTSRWPGYQYLYQYHLVHHKQPNRNYGAVFGPLVDIVFGTQRQEHGKLTAKATD